MTVINPEKGAAGSEFLGSTARLCYIQNYTHPVLIIPSNNSLVSIGCVSFNKSISLYRALSRLEVRKSYRSVASYSVSGADRPRMHFLGKLVRSRFMTLAIRPSAQRGSLSHLPGGF